MVGLTARRLCNHPSGCLSHSRFGLPGTGGTAIRCALHKEPGDVDVFHRSCSHPEGCLKQANFAPPGGIPSRCGTHKEPGMINVSSRRCDHPSGCLKYAGFGTVGGPWRRCLAHREDGMVSKKAKSAPSEGVDGGEPPAAKRQRSVQQPALAPGQPQQAADLPDNSADLAVDAAGSKWTEAELWKVLNVTTSRSEG